MSLSAMTYRDENYKNPFEYKPHTVDTVISNDFDNPRLIDVHQFMGGK